MRIDAHVHVFPPELVSQRAPYLERDLTFHQLYSDPKAAMSSAGELLDSMDRSGIDKSVLVNIGWASADLCRETNTYILEAASASPDRLIPFCSVNPLAGTGAAEEIDRCAGLGARGIGELHPDTQGFDLADPVIMAPLMQAARRHGLPVLTHASEPVGHIYAGKGQVTPQVLFRFATNFPDNAIVCAHWGGGLPFYALMPEVRRALANVSFDTAASPFLYEPAVFATVTRLVGAEKILFGTDFPLVKQERILKQVAGASLDEQAKAKILGGNAARLLRLDEGGDDALPVRRDKGTAGLGGRTGR